MDEDENLAWVAPGHLPAQRGHEPRVARILAAVGAAAASSFRGEASAARLHRGAAAALLAEDALGTLDTMQDTGEIPPAGTQGWARLVELALAGQVEIGFLLIVRGELELDPPPPPAPAGDEWEAAEREALAAYDAAAGWKPGASLTEDLRRMNALG